MNLLAYISVVLDVINDTFFGSYRGLICSSNLIVNLAQERRAALAKRKNKEYINDIDDEMETIRKRTLATEHYYEIAFEITVSSQKISNNGDFYFSQDVNDAITRVISGN